jgi:phosphoglucomutase
MPVDQSILKKAQDYVSNESSDLFRGEVEKLLKDEDWEGLQDRFYTQLSFGTGGLRGVIGGGYNRINPYNVQKTTQGLANYIRREAESSEPAAVIAHDSRRYSDVFAREAAKVFCANGIKTYLFSSLRPTPELSFGVRLLGATAGVVITASHNPPQYNGYKVYWSDGGQIVHPHDSGIIEEVRRVETVSSISEEEAKKKGLLQIIDQEVDVPYLENVKNQALRPRLIKDRGKDLRVVYTPLHGTGAMPVSKALEEMGIEVTFVDEQKDPDGSFPTVKYPNPEEASAMEMALEKAREIGADLVMGTDPDSDRLGIAVPEGDDYRLITGNQLGALLADYIFNTARELKVLPQQAAFIKTIVTSELSRLIAEDCGVRCFDTLTGFKYIAAKIKEFESSGGPTYVFGCEESYGYLVGSAVRDKDAVSAATMTAEMTLYHVSQGKTLLDRLDEIYREYGYFEEVLISGEFTGEEGFKAMQDLMERLRIETPASWGGQAIRVIKDYREGTTRNLETGTTSHDIELPPSNVLQFILNDSTIVTARPSGTEPKIKFYASCRSRRIDGTDRQSMAELKADVRQRLERITKEVTALIEEP